MEHLLAARAQMGTSLAFHFIFSALGIGLPLFMIVIEGLYLRTGDRTYYTLARTWSKMMAALFAIGAVSGTTIAFELGLLWPVFMQYAGGIIGIPFSAEGFAFFIEAIFIGIYLYGWEKLSPRAHWLCSFPIAIGGAASGVFVVCANAWMNTPAGFRVRNGMPVEVHPFVAMFNPAWKTEAVHTLLAAYIFVAFGIVAVSAFKYLRGKPYGTMHAMRVALIVGAIAVPLQIISGDISARFDAHTEPIKSAAMEGQFHTQAGAPLRVGGLPDVAQERDLYSIEIPKMLSVMGFENPNAVIEGLDAVSKRYWPPVVWVHLSFQIMVGTAFALLFIVAWWFFIERGRNEFSRAFLCAAVASGFLGFIAMECGWMVTEEGRQPWIVTGYLLTRDAVTPSHGLGLAFTGFTLLYILLAGTLWWLLVRIDRGIEDAR
jgi:cytochrome d ubiquinol oxidase subunit I